MISSQKSPKISFYTAIAIVIANMIGTGVFTSLGFQLFDIRSVFSIILLWTLGGVVALCGALCYGELAAAMPRSGSEYHYLSKIYHPIVGFLSGWVSLTVGFSAPVAAAAMALGKYTAFVFPFIDPTFSAAAIVIMLTFIHCSSIRTGSSFQNIFTSLKVILIVFIVIAGVTTVEHQDVSSLQPTSASFKEIFSKSFAVSLFWVFYAYSGWNASAYLAGEISEPQKNVPKSLFYGTLLVTILYVLLNFVFLYVAPISELMGREDVGNVAAFYIFGETGGKFIGLVIALLLVSSVSSMIIAGPRVNQVMGEDNQILSAFARTTASGIPATAIVFQSFLSLIMIFTSSFESIIIYVGFTLNIFLFLTVLGLIILRIRQPQLERPYKTWGYPFTPIIFLAVTLWLLYFGIVSRPQESLIGLATVMSGIPVYLLGKTSERKDKSNS